MEKHGRPSMIAAAGCTVGPHELAQYHVVAVHVGSAWEQCADLCHDLFPEVAVLNHLQLVK